MIDVKSKSRINVHWNVSPYDYNKEKEKSIVAKFSKKYNIPKDKIKIIFVDIDWTLLNHKYKPGKYDMSSIRALKRIQKKGINYGWII